MTYSIVAHDASTGQLGVAVQSHFFAVGNRVPWAEAGVGAVATQSFTDLSYGPMGLDLMREGKSAPEALAILRDRDPRQHVRQVAMVDSQGRTATFTGEGCVEAAGHIQDDQASAQANMMVSPRTWHSMIEAFRRAEGDLADRMLAALEAAEGEGGDLRGRQSAALIVVEGVASRAPWDHVVLNVRVDDHHEPLQELRRLVIQGRHVRELLLLFRKQGLMIGAFAGSRHDMDEALRVLTLAAADTKGNAEPAFWMAVLLGRAGRDAEARAHLARISESNPGWATLARRLESVGMVPPGIFTDPSE